MMGVLVFVLVLVLGGCYQAGTYYPEGDTREPRISAETRSHLLYADVFDAESGVAAVEIAVDGQPVARYTSGFRSIIYDLSAAPAGANTVRIIAIDVSGNRAYADLRYTYEAYETESVLLERHVEPVYGDYGLHVADLEVVHRRISYTPVDSAPPRDDEYQHLFFIHNRLGMYLYHTSVEVIASDVYGATLWSRRLTPGTIAPGTYVESDTVSTSPVSPARYVVSLRYQL
jgi:hypothetical protein